MRQPDGNSGDSGTAIGIGDFPVMKKHCASCPFRRGADGREANPELANSVRTHLLSASQICHHPRLAGKKENRLCRGGRDEQLTLMHRLGVIAAANDEAWEAKRAELNV